METHPIDTIAEAAVRDRDVAVAHQQRCLRTAAGVRNIEALAGILNMDILERCSDRIEIDQQA